jgi:C4-dicarboxylate transporter
MTNKTTEGSLEVAKVSVMQCLRNMQAGTVAGIGMMIIKCFGFAMVVVKFRTGNWWVAQLE